MTQRTALNRVHFEIQRSKRTKNWKCCLNPTVETCEPKEMLVELKSYISKSVTCFICKCLNVEDDRSYHQGKQHKYYTTIKSKVKSSKKKFASLARTKKILSQYHINASKIHKNYYGWIDLYYSSCYYFKLSKRFPSPANKRSIIIIPILKLL